MKKFEVLNEKQLEEIAGGKGFFDGFKKVHKAIFWADRDSKKNYFENKFYKISEGFGEANSTSAAAGIVAVDAGAVAVAGLAVTAANLALGGAIAEGIRRHLQKVKSIVKK